ncbi:MAG: glycosyltransferase family 2 protein [Chloroflexi bacterium]|nr:MAG: glycosyltransferase family 2 protein [Chloroflexota bacterium]
MARHARAMARHAATETPHVSVIVLVYNEVDSVEPLHRELMGVLDAIGTSFEVLYIDDGSRDGSNEKLGQIAARDERVRVVSFRRNFGRTAAVQAGIDHSRGAVLVFFDGDMQNDPHDIPHLLEKMDEGYDVASGWRRARAASRSRALLSSIANGVMARLTGVGVSDFGCTLKAFRREVIEGVRLDGEMRRLLPVYAAEAGARITELPVNHRPRTYGKSKYSLAASSRVLLDLVAVKLVGGSPRPVYSLGVAAAGAWLLALAAGVVVAVQRVVPPYVHVHANLLVVAAVGLAIIGVQLFLAALTIKRSESTYVVREVIARPPHRQPGPMERTAGRATLR